MTPNRPHGKDQTPDLKRELGLLDASMINIGTMIGSGIFFVPATIIGYFDSSGPYFAVWLLGGIVSLFGALAIAELGAASPRTGGLFVYLKDAFGPLWGFLYGWSSLSVINSASIAAIAMAFAGYLGEFGQLSSTAIKIIALAAIWLLTLFNCMGVKMGALIQNSLGFVKVGGILFLVLAAVLFTGGSVENFHPILPPTHQTGLFGAFGLAMIAVLWSFDGWIEVTYTAGEVRNPQKTLPRAILLSTLLVILVYFLVNIAYMYLLGPSGIKGSQRVAADAARVVLGNKGAIILTLAVMFSTFGACNGFILGAARIYYAMAREKLFFAQFGKIHPTRKTPVFSLVIQAIWSSILALSGTFNQLITYMIFASWVFYILCVLAVFVMRRKYPNIERPYKTWGYPFTPILFLLFATLLVFNAIVEDPKSSLIGLCLILAGVPVFYLTNANNAASRSSATNKSGRG